MDYDVAALSLATPPASAPVQSYRPAVAVKNLGIHDADVTGTLSIYDRDAGTLITRMNLAANSIEPGETRNAVADQLWEPVTADIGRAFLFIATITYPPDQNLSNNNLAPVTVIVTAAPPTPPPPVEAHADQHEDGGGDELDVDGLTGKLAEAQTPSEHASNHEDGGTDQLDVAGLTGELATPQTPKAHASTHQLGGTDVISGIEPSAHASSHEPGGDDVLGPLPPAEHAGDHILGGNDSLPDVPFFAASSVGFAPVVVDSLVDSSLGTQPLSLAALPAKLLVIAQVKIVIPDSPLQHQAEFYPTTPSDEGPRQSFVLLGNPASSQLLPITLVCTMPYTEGLESQVDIHMFNLSPSTLTATIVSIAVFPML